PTPASSVLYHPVSCYLQNSKFDLQIQPRMPALSLGFPSNCLHPFSLAIPCDLPAKMAFCLWHAFRQARRLPALHQFSRRGFERVILPATARLFNPAPPAAGSGAWSSRGGGGRRGGRSIP